MASKDKQNGLLKGQVAVVTGSTQGIGAGIVRKLAEHGACVLVHGLDQAKGNEVVAQIQTRGGEAAFELGDLKEETVCRRVILSALDRFGRLDILVNNAAVVHRGTIESTTLALWDEILATNLRAPFILCQEAIRHMKERRSGCIINIGSLNAYIGLKKLFAYSVSKGGLTTLTRNLANYLVEYRIRVNQINPGWVLTEGERHVQAVVEGKGEGWLEAAVKTRPFGRMLLPEDIARGVLFFATNPMITGAVLDYEQEVAGALREV